MKAKLIKHIIKKVPILMAAVIITVSSFSMTASAGLLGTDSISSEVYGTATTGNLSVYDTYATATTSYARSGSNISISVAINATFRYGGKDHYLNDYDDSTGGGATAQVEFSITDYPNAAFLEVDGSHEVRNYINGVLLTSGHWLDFTNWKR